MSVYLHTGKPGHGKTLNMIREIVKYVEQNKANQALKDDGKEHAPIRPIYTNIKGLKIEGVDPILDSLEEHPVGSIVIVDECQTNTIFQAGFSSVKHSNNTEIIGFPVSDVKYIPLHRHKGHDLHFVTQSPIQINNVIKAHVEEHFHTERLNGAKRQRVLVFQNIVPNPHTLTDAKRATAIRDNRYSFEKKYFDLYKSTELDTFKFKMPKKAWFFGIGIILVLGFVFFMFRSSSDSVVVKNALGTETTFDELSEDIKSGSSDISAVVKKIDPITFEQTRPAMVIKSSDGTCHARNSYGDFLDIDAADCLAMATDHRRIPRSRIISETDNKQEAI